MSQTNLQMMLFKVNNKDIASEFAECLRLTQPQVQASARKIYSLKSI